MWAIDEDEVVGIVLGFRNAKAFDGVGVLSSDVAVNNEFNNVDACKTDVDMLDATMLFGVDVEGEPINGT